MLFSALLLLLYEFPEYSVFLKLKQLVYLKLEQHLIGSPQAVMFSGLALLQLCPHNQSPDLAVPHISPFLFCSCRQSLVSWSWKIWV